MAVQLHHTTPLPATTTTQKRLEGFLQRCRKTGLKVTVQRIAVYRTLLSSQGHLPTEDIYLKIRKEQPSISLSTVYNTLEAFHQHGLLSKVFCNDQAARYDTVTDPHQHFVCNKCNSIQDIHLSSNQLPQYQHSQNKTLSVDIYFRGLCKDCSQ